VESRRSDEMGQRAEALASEFEKAVAELAKTVEGCSDEKWGKICSDEGWTVGQTAQHVSGQFPLEMEFITAAADGKPLPSYTWDDINDKNGSRADRNKGATKAQVLKELKEGGASTAAYLRGLSDEQLDRTGALGLAGGAEVSTEQLVKGGVLIEHVTGHLQSIVNAE
jgi:hypothetical protein